MNSKTMVGVIVAVVVLAGLGYWYYTSSSTPAIQETINQEPVVEEAVPTPDTGGGDESATGSSVVEEGVRVVNVESNGLNFTPKEIKVKQGEKVRIVYKNNMGTHDWTLDEFNVKTKLTGAGQTDTVEFTADQVGTFEYYCSVPGHRQAGMKGNLVVE